MRTCDFLPSHYNRQTTISPKLLVEFPFGNATKKARAEVDDGRPREKRRTIGLRRGDQVMRDGGWCKIRRIRSIRSELVAREIVHRLRAGVGYVYRLKK